ncbi:MAG: bifunctional DNA-formamidopyrimidine glycosylase/DNA-(apurinic or apyrimidinic site) lyase [Candidatus Limnocylindrales bacterium]
MPELPEVETIARELRPLVVGSVVSSVWTDWPRVVRHPAPAAFAAGLTGREVLDVTRRAKWLVLPLSGEAALVVQVKMTGQLFVLPTTAPRDRHVHLVIGFVDGRELRLRDVRKFARVGLYRRGEDGLPLAADEAAELFAGHGPEPLDPAFTLRAWRTLLRDRRGRLKPLLLDQSFLAGVGNIYAAEALWRARLHPLRAADSLRPADERRLYEAIQGVLREGIERRGSSVGDYTAPEGDGEMQEHLDVYQRTGLPCRRCGRPIKRIVLGARSTHFCSWCQRLPKAQRTPANLKLLAGATTGGRRGRMWDELPIGEGSVGTRWTRSARRAARDR